MGINWSERIHLQCSGNRHDLNLTFYVTSLLMSCIEDCRGNYGKKRWTYGLLLYENTWCGSHLYGDIPSAYEQVETMKGRSAIYYSIRIHCQFLGLARDMDWGTDQFVVNIKYVQGSSEPRKKRGV